MIHGSLGEGDAGSSLRYGLLYILKILLFLAPIAVAAVLSLHGAGWQPSGSGSSPVSGVSAAGGNVVYTFLIPMALVVVLAFAAGYFHPGTRGRLLMRVLLNVCLAAAILVLAQGVGYAAQDLLVSETYSVTSQSITVSVGLAWLMAPLLLIPVLSVADAYLEYTGCAGVLSMLGRRGGDA